MGRGGAEELGIVTDGLLTGVSSDLKQVIARAMVTKLALGTE